MNQPDFEYGGRLLSPEPTNLSLKVLAGGLSAGHTAYAQLEPGDATRYDILLVPMWGPAGFGGPYDREDYKWLFITRLRSGGSVPSLGCMIRRDFRSYDFQEIAGGNTHTANLLAWWHVCLQLEMGYKHPSLLPLADK